MSVFPNWSNFVVPQRRPETGCIPTGYEILLRAQAATGVDFTTFQDEFDLESQNLGKNDFNSVAEAIKKIYPRIKFEIKKFKQGDGDRKLAFIESHLVSQRPILISLTLGLDKGWHIMVIVDADETNLTLLHHVDLNGIAYLKKISKEEFVRIHDTLAGGDDVAFLP